jgi:ribonucleotide monophosphatase NagD (HAD superfamily)
MVIAIDFDGTLVQGDKALPGAKEAVNILREAGHKVMIFSCNGNDWVRRVLEKNDMVVDYIWEAGKPICDLYIDDRAIQFKGDWKETLAEALKGRSKWSAETH